jgi:hypothetical protein
MMKPASIHLQNHSNSERPPSMANSPLQRMAQICQGSLQTVLAFIVYTICYEMPTQAADQQGAEKAKRPLSAAIDTCGRERNLDRK